MIFTNPKDTNINIYKLELINNTTHNNNYIYSYVISLLSIMILFPLLYLDIFQNGIILINYLNII